MSTVLERPAVSALLFGFIPMLRNYVPVFLILAVVGLLASIALRISRIFGLLTPAPLDPIRREGENDDTLRRRPERHFVVAVLFVVFAGAMVFLLPWAVVFMALGVAGLIEILVFLGVLAAGCLWIWKKGALAWL
jgi:NADH-quinone oxidoreductase subunit A